MLFILINSDIYYLHLSIVVECNNNIECKLLLKLINGCRHIGKIMIYYLALFSHFISTFQIFSLFLFFENKCLSDLICDEKTEMRSLIKQHF